MRIGELAGNGVRVDDTVRFYERSGWLPRATRQDEMRTGSTAGVTSSTFGY